MKTLKYLVFFTLVSGTAFAQTLDLGSLTGFDYSGKDASHNGAACHLSAGPIKQDFSGRMVQDYRLWTDGAPEANFNLRLKGPNRFRDGKEILGTNDSLYSVAIDVYSLDITANTNNPAVIMSFKLIDASGVTTSVLMNCVDVKAIPR